MNSQIHQTKLNLVNPQVIDMIVEKKNLEEGGQKTNDVEHLLLVRDPHLWKNKNKTNANMASHEV